MRVNALSVGLRSLDTKFFAQAMLNDLDGFLSSLSSTQDSKDAWRNAEVVGSACDCPGIDRREFNVVRGSSETVEDESASFALAQRCRKEYWRIRMQR